MHDRYLFRFDIVALLLLVRAISESGASAGFARVAMLGLSALLIWQLAGLPAKALTGQLWVN